MTVHKSNQTAVIGAGSWGTALAKLLGDKGEKVLLWGHDKGHLAALQRERENKKYLPGAKLPDSVVLTGNLEQAVAAAGFIVMVVPSHGYREVFARLAPRLRKDALIVSAVKGIENNTLQTMTQIMHDIVDREHGRRNLHFGVLSGPSFAAEVAVEQPTAVTVAFAGKDAARSVQELFSTHFFRVYTSSDVIGLEMSAAMKNVVAIAAGICDGLGFGLNTRAALITRGLAEISRLGVHLGAHPLTFSGLGGLGDLVLTCTGNLSRNRTVGLKLGEGKSLDQALGEMTMVAEGVRTTRSCYMLARKNNVEMPILEQTYQVLYENKNCRQAVQDLFQRSLKEEMDFQGISV
ncbi:MAG: NAD(P)H-dependent glycerol-3-phosphate dehydrogenase [Desulfobulbaceae bacterium]|nr:NAD(P)H-dependent glycerol-3-phosphate dehydrogenase [Desulfobulbaceae bacterium]